MQLKMNTDAWNKLKKNSEGVVSKDNYEYIGDYDEMNNLELKIQKEKLFPERGKVTDKMKKEINTASDTMGSIISMSTDESRKIKDGKQGALNCDIDLIKSDGTMKVSGIYMHPVLYNDGKEVTRIDPYGSDILKSMMESPQGDIEILDIVNADVQKVIIQYIRQKTNNLTINFVGFGLVSTDTTLDIALNPYKDYESNVSVKSNTVFGSELANILKTIGPIGTITRAWPNKSIKELSFTLIVADPLTFANGELQMLVKNVNDVKVIL